MTDHDVRAMLDDLQASLSQALIDARSDRVAEAADAIDRAGETMTQLASLAGPLADHGEQIDAIHKLYGELQLVMAQKKDDAGRKRGKSIRGQVGLRGYRSATSKPTR